MITVLRKSTVRPWPSVSRPSYRIWSRALKTSGCAFSTSSEQNHLVGPTPNCFGELTALIEADVAWRRTEQAADGVRLHVLGHVQPQQGVLVVEEVVGRVVLASSVLPDTGRPGNRNEPMGRL